MVYYCAFCSVVQKSYVYWMHGVVFDDFVWKTCFSISGWFIEDLKDKLAKKKAQEKEKKSKAKAEPSRDPEFN